MVTIGMGNQRVKHSSQRQVIRNSSWCKLKILFFAAEEEKQSNFPWKVDRSDEPVVYTEENEEKDDDDEKNKQSGGVKFSIGFTEEEANEIVDEDEEEQRRVNEVSGEVDEEPISAVIANPDLNADLNKIQ